MTRFEKDLEEAKKDAFMAVEILRERDAEITKLEDELRKTKNGFRRTCIKQEIDRLTEQFEEIDKWA